MGKEEERLVFFCFHLLLSEVLCGYVSRNKIKHFAWLAGRFSGVGRAFPLLLS